MGRVTTASATSEAIEAIEAIEAEVLPKVRDVLHHSAVGEGEASAESGGGGGRAKRAAGGCWRAKRAYRRRPRSSCRRQRIASKVIIDNGKLWDLN